MSSISSHWRIQQFGEIKAHRGPEEITLFGTKNTAWLLGYLAARPDRAFQREELIDLLWPASELAAGRNSLNVTLSALRKLLGDTILLSAGATGKGCVRINPAAVVTDLGTFHALLNQPGDCAETQIESYSKALDIHCGELLPGLDDEWTIAERQRVWALFLSGVRKIAQLLADANRKGEALAHVRRAIQLDPAREDLRRLAIQLHCSLGNRSDALREYSEITAILMREMGVSPSAKTADLYHRLVHPNSEMSEAGRKADGPDFKPRPGRQAGLAPACEHRSAPLFGRDQSIIDLSDLLRSGTGQLVSLTGIGGVGKTRLARAAAETVSDVFVGGIYHVPLADVGNVEQIEPAILQAMGVRRDGRTNARAQLAEALRNRSVLLVLDSMEMLLPSAATTVRALLDGHPQLSCLVTTRQRLNLSGEREVPVLPLDVPSLTAPPDEIMASSSVQLFAHRASQAEPGLALTPGRASGMAAICRCLDGLPLAIEMAAAWTRVLSPREILERLTPRLPMLVSRDVDASDRHSSVRRTLQCSYDMMPAHLQRLFIRLSVFRGGWSGAAAAALSGCSDGAAANSATMVDLMDLRDRSLVTIVGESDPIRLTYLELVREFAAERLADSGERAEACELHAGFFLNLVESAAPHLRGPDAGRWLDALDKEQDNLREALRWTLNGGSPDCGIRLAVSLWQYWLLRGHITEGIDWLVKADGSAETAVSTLRARVKLGLGQLCYVAGDYGQAAVFLNAAVQGFRHAGDECGEADAVNGLGNVAFVQGDWPNARSYYERGLCLYVQLGNTQSEASVLSNLANVAAETGDVGTATLYFDRCLSNLRTGSDTHTLATVLANSVGTLFLINDLKTAEVRLRECIDISLRDGYPRVLAHSFEGIATLHLKQQRWRDAAVMFAAAAQIRKRIHALLSQSHVASYQADYDTLRDALGSEAFEQEWRYGSNMSDDAAADYCLGGAPAETGSGAAQPHRILS